MEIFTTVRASPGPGPRGVGATEGLRARECALAVLAGVLELVKPVAPCAVDGELR